jgi:signal transduction histidine kinase
MGRGSRRPWFAASVTLSLGLVATVLIVTVPGARLAYQSPTLYAFIEGIAALIALLAAFLVLGRYRRRGNVDDLLLALALTAIALATLVYSALPAAVGSYDNALAWSAASGQVFGAAILAVAAFAPSRPARPGLARVLTLIVAVGLVELWMIAITLESRLPLGIDPLEQGTSNISFHGAGGVMALHLAGLVAFDLAAVGFIRRVRHGEDELFVWLSVAVTVATVAQINYVFYPSLHTGWVYSGDVFRVLFYLALLGAAAREIALYWRSLSRVAVLEERRRIARDLHDGLAQELSFIVRRARPAERGLDERSTAAVASAAERALFESRRAIATLTRPLDEPLDVVLAQVMDYVLSRNETPHEFDLAPGVRVDPAVREAFVRIASEAVSNAAKHAQPRLVRVSLEGPPKLRLRVVDDGVGFDIEKQASRNGSFGLVTMRERAQGIGASFRLVSAPGKGTQIEVSLP